LGWDLAPGHPDAELVESAYRVPLDLAANATLETEVGLERTIGESHMLTDMNTEALVYYAESGELEPRLRDALTKLAVKRAEIDDLRRRIERLEQEKARLFEDQSRLRDNLSRVPSESDLHARYLTKLAAEETALDKLGLEAEATRDALVKAETAYAEMIRTLDV
jgi:predicted nuclease with TOPRIM domain